MKKFCKTIDNEYNFHEFQPFINERTDLGELLTLKTIQTEGRPLKLFYKTYKEYELNKNIKRIQKDLNFKLRRTKSQIDEIKISNDNDLIFPKKQRTISKYEQSSLRYIVNNNENEEISNYNLSKEKSFFPTELNDLENIKKQNNVFFKHLKLKENKFPKKPVILKNKIHPESVQHYIPDKIPPIGTYNSLDLDLIKNKAPSYIFNKDQTSSHQYFYKLLKKPDYSPNNINEIHLPKLKNKELIQKRNSFYNINKEKIKNGDCLKSYKKTVEFSYKLVKNYDNDYWRRLNTDIKNLKEHIRKIKGIIHANQSDHNRMALLLKNSSKIVFKNS